MLDFGSQYTQLIARRVRELGVYCEIFTYDAPFKQIQQFQPVGVILSGGPATVTEPLTARVSHEILNLGVPVLGICYGMQTMVAQLGGEVENALIHEYGSTQIRLVGDSPLTSQLQTSSDETDSDALEVWMSHGDRVVRLPQGFSPIAQSDASPYAAIGNSRRKFYGLQFHPEVTHTAYGKQIIEQFLYKICNCSGSWKPDRVIDDLIEFIRHQVGSDRVILALSGGVDSSVCAALLQKAIGDQLTCVFVDNGLLRLNEAKLVRKAVAEKIGINLISVDASERFLDALSGVEEPEMKRKIIGRVFIDIFQEQAEKLDHIKWLAQGTIYPDVIESAGAKTNKAKVIKSHHNVGGLPEMMNLKLLEPLRELFKDEVRQIGEKLGLAHELVHRHPFPGPGLGVRIVGEVKKHYADLLRAADHIFLEELTNRGMYYQASQAFAVFLPVKSVGVVGDNRAYEYVVCLRAVQTVDFMTATCMRIPYDILEQIAGRIVNEIPGISRVAYDISSKPPATIEWE